MIQPQYLAVVRELLDRLQGTGVSWALTGSMGMALQGMDLTIHDIDVQTDAAGAYAIERCLAEYTVQPVRFVGSERMRSHLGALEIGGVKVEIIGALQKRLGDGSWEEPVQVDRHKRWVDLAGLRIPVLALEYEYEAYRTMGRLEKAEMIKAWLERTHIK